MTLHKQAVSLKIGGVYSYYLGGRYVLIGVGRHAHTHQKLVAYRGIEGDDEGELYFCPLVDWATKFERADLSSPVGEEPPQESRSIDLVRESHGDGSRRT